MKFVPICAITPCTPENYTFNVVKSKNGKKPEHKEVRTVKTQNDNLSEQKNFRTIRMSYLINFFVNRI